MSDEQKPNKVQLRDIETGETRFVRFGSDEHHALMAERHSEVWHKARWEQVFDFEHRWG